MTLQHSGLPRAVLTDARNVEWFEPIAGEKINILLQTHQTGGAYSIAEIIVAPRAGPPMHIHHDADEILYVLEGVVDLVCGDERFQTGPGGMAAIPKGTPHAFRNFGDAQARMLGFLTPGGFEQFFHAMSGRPTSDVPLLAADYCLEIVGPPIDADGTEPPVHALTKTEIKDKNLQRGGPSCGAVFGPRLR